MTRIGVRGFPEGAWIDLIDDFEIDALDPKIQSVSFRRKIIQRFLPHQNLTLAFGHYFLRGEDSVDRRERVRTAAERCDLFGAKSSSVLVPQSFEKQESLFESLNYFHEEFKRLGLRPPRVDAPFTSQFPLERIGDPLWQNSKSEYSTREWRIHGYHPTRWVRIYSKEALQELANAAIRYQPERILFAHSQRFIQACDFINQVKNIESLRCE